VIQINASHIIAPIAFRGTAIQAVFLDHSGTYARASWWIDRPWPVDGPWLVDWSTGAGWLALLGSRIWKTAAEDAFQDAPVRWLRVALIRHR
jgi:hypothetical protein